MMREMTTHEAAEAIHRTELAATVKKLPKAGPKGRKGPLSPEERVAAVRKVVTEHSATRIEGLLVDATSAAAYVAVYDGLDKPENKARLAAMDLRKAMEIVWKLVK